MDQPTNLQPYRSDYVAILAGVAMTLAMGAFSFGSAAWADTTVPVTANDTRIVRAVHGTSCDARVIGAGSTPRAASNEVLEELSVSCSNDPEVGLDALRQAMPATHACVVVLSDLRKVAPGLRLVRDPSSENPYRCKLSRVTPNQFVSRASWLQ